MATRPAKPIFVASVAALLFAFAGSLGFGVRAIAPDTVITALVANDGSVEHIIVTTVRLPRALIAAVVGASLAVAGAMMQALTRNPLAGPGILGINAGAALAVVLATFALRQGSAFVHAGFAMLGAALVAGAVYVFGSLGRGGLTPLRLTVAGAALTSVCASLTQGMLIANQRGLDEMRFWLAGSVAGREGALLAQVFPIVVVGMAAALALSPQLTTFSLGEDVARALGQPTHLVKAGSAVSIVLLAGASVAIAGPISFVGLAVPHTARALVGSDYRCVVPLAAVLGAALLLLADLGARAVRFPQEVPVGVMTALVGAPFFIYLARGSMHRL